MGSITRSLANNITTSGVILPAGITNASVADVTSFANASGGTLILLSTQTASNSATISFTSGLDSTYDAYEFHCIDIQPRTNAVSFLFNMSTESTTAVVSQDQQDEQTQTQTQTQQIHPLSQKWTLWYGKWDSPKVVSDFDNLESFWK